MARTGFFTRTPVVQDKKYTDEYSFINIGGETFHALAVALIDKLKNTPRVNEVLLKTLLERFFAYYPKYKTQQPYLTPAERMGMLINSARKSEVVDCMAYVLRQLTMDEVYANPLSYREVFDGLEPTTLKGVLRDSDTVLSVSALNALARVLGISISLFFTERGKELRKREIYTDPTDTSSKLELAVQVQGDHYFPRVKNKTDFAYVGQLAITPPEPVHMSDDNNENIAEIMDLITNDNQRLLQSYQQWRQNLLIMVEGKELSTSDLLDFYIKFLPLTKGTISDTQAFFSKLTKQDQKIVTGESVGNACQQMNELLASALAEWISTNKIDVDHLFDRIEAQSTTTSKASAR